MKNKSNQCVLRITIFSRSILLRYSAVIGITWCEGKDYLYIDIILSYMEQKWYLIRGTIYNVSITRMQYIKTNQNFQWCMAQLIFTFKGYWISTSRYTWPSWTSRGLSINIAQITILLAFLFIHLFIYYFFLG